MLKVRIIPLLLLKGNSLVKSVSFSNHRIVGDAISTIKVFSRRFADEMIILDLDAREKNCINTNLLERISSECNMPLTFGGGIDTIEKADRAFYCGADKITLNSAFFTNPEIASDIANKYGSQAVVLSIDIRKENNNYKIYQKNATEPVENFKLEEAIKLAKDMGVGEFLINDIFNDGLMTGFDLQYIEDLRKKIDLPLIVAGGCSSIKDFEDAFKLGVDAVAAGSIFHWIGESIIGIKENLYEKNINVRML